LRILKPEPSFERDIVYLFH